jgi:putative ABC transport system permease protein
LHCCLNTRSTRLPWLGSDNQWTSYVVLTHVGPFLRNLQTAFSGLRDHRQRAVLSALGITVGSSAIVLLISIAKGIQADVSHQVDGLGVNLLFVLPARFDGDSMFAPGLMGISRLTDRDVERVRRISGVKRACPITFVGAGVAAGKRSSEATFVVASGPEWVSMRQWKLQAGRLLSPEDDGRAVSVIGSKAAATLFGDGNPVGKQVVTGGRPYTVVGVTQDEEGSQSIFAQGFLQNVVYVPYATVKHSVGSLQINRIVIQTQPESEPKALVAAIDRALGERLGKNDYSVMTPQDLLQMIYKLMGILTWLLTGLTSIGLFVGGVGIMTVMLMSVNERAKEIGVRMTVGARRSDVFLQFLCEATVLSLCGGTAGLLIGYLADLALYFWTPVKPLITVELCGLTLGMCLGVGVVFGLIPAMKAARRQPIDSLRYE